MRCGAVDLGAVPRVVVAMQGCLWEGALILGGGSVVGICELTDSD